MIECQNCTHFENCPKVGHKCTLTSERINFDNVTTSPETLTNKEEVKPDFLKLCMEGSEDMMETVHKVMANMEYKFEIDAIIALLRKLLLAVQNYYLGYRTFKGVQGIQVEGALECIIAAMEAEKKKDEEDVSH